MLRSFYAAAIALGLVLVGDALSATLVSRLVVNVDAALSNPLDLVTASAPLSLRKSFDFASGTGAFQANVVWSDSRSLAGAASEDLDFAGGGLTDAFGVAVAPAKVRLVVIASSTTNTTDLTLFGDTNSVPLLNTAATTVTLQPGGVYVFSAPAIAGRTVTAGTGDIIQVANGAGATATYEILVLGTTS